MKVLLVRPQNNWSSRIVGPEIGLGVLATQLRKEGGYEISLYDCIKENVQSMETFRKRVEAEKPDVVAFKAFTMDIPWTHRASAVVKQANPNAVTLAGGPHASGDPQHCLNYLEHIDFAFRGEGEIGFVQLLSRIKEAKKKRNGNGASAPWRNEAANLGFQNVPGMIWRSNGDVTVNPQMFIMDLDSIGFPAWDLIDPRTYTQFNRSWGAGGVYTPIYFTRGCPYDCTFCAVKIINGKKFRKRSVPNIIQELEMLYTRYGVRNMSIADDMLTLDRRYTMQVLQGVIDSGLKFKWDFPNGIRVTTLDEEMLHKMEEAGWVSMCVAVESGSERILKHMLKDITIDEIRTGVKLARKHTKMELVGFFILGYPEETEADIRASIKFALELPLDLCCFFYFTPHPGTEVYQHILKNYPQKFKEVDWTSFHYDRPTFSPPKIPEKKFEKMVKGAYFRFFLRPRIIRGILKRRKQYRLSPHLIIWKLLKRTFSMIFLERRKPKLSRLAANQ